jgi:hypothetical protein
MSKAEFKRSKALRNLLETSSHELARETGFVQRSSKMSGPVFVETRVLGHLQEPAASLNELIQVSAGLGVTITQPGLNARINEEAVALLRGIFEGGLKQLQASDRQMAHGLLQHFSAVYILDSSIVTLPASLQSQFAGFSTPGTQAAVTLQLGFEYLRGNRAALELGPGRLNDQSCTLGEALAGPNTLHLADLGYFSQDTFARIAERGAYFVSRLKFGTHLYAQPGDNTPLDLLATLRAQGSLYQLSCYLGARQRLSVRLIAERLPEAIAQKRRRKALEAARAKGHTCPQAYLELLGWSLFITNLPSGLFSPAQVLALYHLPWHIELVFKVWKSHAKLARTQHLRPQRVLCTLYARLIALLVFHWLIAPVRLVKCRELSLTKACHTCQRFVVVLLASVRAGGRSTPTLLLDLASQLSRFARHDQRKKNLSTFQLLAGATP